MRTIPSSRRLQGLAAATIAAVTLGIVADRAVSAYALKGPKWPSTQVGYYVNPANLDMSSDAALAVVQESAANWATQSNADFSYYYMGQTTTTSATYDGQNNVMFRNESNGSSGATTYSWSTGGTTLLDFDIVVWDGAFKFLPDSLPCSGDAVYLQDAMTHEFGHALGLGHSTVAAATMYPSLSYCSTALRELDPDDIAGVETLYPPAASIVPDSPTGLAASAGSSNSIALAWTDTSNNENGFTVERSVDGVSFTTIAQVGANSSRYTNSGLSSNTRYTYRVRAYNGTGSSSYSNAASATTLQAAPTNTFTLAVSARRVKSTRYADLKWGGSTASQLNLFRNGAKLKVVSNAGSYTDSIGRAAGTFQYQLCDTASATTCSTVASVTF